MLFLLLRILFFPFTKNHTVTGEGTGLASGRQEVGAGKIQAADSDAGFGQRLSRK